MECHSLLNGMLSAVWTLFESVPFNAFLIGSVGCSVSRRVDVLGSSVRTIDVDKVYKAFCIGTENQASPPSKSPQDPQGRLSGAMRW